MSTLYVSLNFHIENVIPCFIFQGELLLKRAKENFDLTKPYTKCGSDQESDEDDNRRRNKKLLLDKAGKKTNGDQSVTADTKNIVFAFTLVKQMLNI